MLEQQTSFKRKQIAKT